MSVVESLEELVVDTKEGRLKRMRRAILTTARLTQQVLQASRVRYRVWMLTLTYKDVDGWAPEQITQFLRCVRMWGKRRGFETPYSWVAELQQRGAVHYHVALWLPRGVTPPKADKQGWWRHGMTRTEAARRAVGYLAKYVSKFESKSCRPFPKGLRLYGSGCLAAAVRLVRRWWMLPGFLRSSCNPAHDFIRAAGGGFVSRGLGGLLVASPWRIAAISGAHVRLVRVGPQSLSLPALEWSDPIGLTRPLGA